MPKDLPVRQVSTHSRPKAAGPFIFQTAYKFWFQHTAARRRLAIETTAYLKLYDVSTHSRPKAAGAV